MLVRPSFSLHLSVASHRGESRLWREYLVPQRSGLNTKEWKWNTSDGKYLVFARGFCGSTQTYTHKLPANMDLSRMFLEKPSLTCPSCSMFGPLGPKDRDGLQAPKPSNYSGTADPSASVRARMSGVRTPFWCKPDERGRVRACPGGRLPAALPSIPNLDLRDKFACHI